MFFFLIGLWGAGLPLMYAILISFGIYFGIKVYVGRRKRAIANDVGQGLCAECGEKIINKKCPNCDNSESK